MGTAEFEYAVGINLLALESRALSTLFFPSSSVILYSNLFIILSTSLMTTKNATDDAQGSPDEPPLFRNTTPAVTPSALSSNRTQRRLESFPLSESSTTEEFIEQTVHDPKTQSRYLDPLRAFFHSTVWFQTGHKARCNPLLCHSLRKPRI